MKTKISKILHVNATSRGPSETLKGQFWLEGASIDCWSVARGGLREVMWVVIFP